MHVILGFGITIPRAPLKLYVKCIITKITSLLIKTRSVSSIKNIYTRSGLLACSMEVDRVYFKLGSLGFLFLVPPWGRVVLQACYIRGSALRDRVPVKC